MATMPNDGDLQALIMDRFERAGIASSADMVNALRRQISTMWTLYADKGLLNPRIQFLYALREAVSLLRGKTFDQTNYSEAGVEESLGDQSGHLEKLYADLTADIERQEQQAMGALGAVVVPINTPATLLPLSPWGARPASSRYRGDPRKGSRFWPWG